MDGFANNISSSSISNVYVLGENSGIDNVFATTISANSTVDNLYYSSYYDTTSIPLGVSATKATSTNIKRPFTLEPTQQAPVSDISFQIGINSGASSSLSFQIGFALDGVNDLYGIGLDNEDYLTKIDDLLTVVSNKATEYGAMQNRLESALDEISIKYENLVSSRSTIRDADIAEVSSQYIQQQILQQASATLMATANQTPAIALQLI